MTNDDSFTFRSVLVSALLPLIIGLVAGGVFSAADIAIKAGIGFVLLFIIIFYSMNMIRNKDGKILFFQLLLGLVGAIVGYLWMLK